jgi:glycine/D-amino acid oxidase-like deaminating enzyme
MTLEYPRPISYWQHTQRNSTPLHEMPRDAEIVVIGAGVHGASAAYWAARLGGKPVVLERGLPAHGASGRNGGLCVVGPAGDYSALAVEEGRARARTILLDTLAGYRMLAEVVAGEHIEASLRPNGHLSLALSSDEFGRMRSSVELMKEDGIEVEMVDAGDLKRWFAIDVAADVVGAQFIADAAQLHSGDLVNGLLAAATRYGARVCAGVEVIAVEPDPVGVRVITNQGDLRAGAVCLCVNAWSAQLIPALNGIVTPVRGQVLAYGQSPRAFDVGIGVSVTPTGEYGQQLPNGEIVFGGCRALASGGDVGSYDVAASDEVQRGLEDVLPRLFPKIELGPVTRRWSGTMAFTADHNPVFGRLGSMPVYYAGGFSGHGMPYAMRFGGWLARSAIQGELVEDAKTYAVERLW